MVRVGLINERDGFVGAEGAGDFSGSGFKEAIDDVWLDPSFGGPGVEVRKIHLVGFIILGVESEGIGFDSEVGVFADEDHIAVTVALQFERHGQNRIVTIVSIEFGGEVLEGFAVAQDDAEMSTVVKFDGFGEASPLRRSYSNLVRSFL